MALRAKRKAVSVLPTNSRASKKMRLPREFSSDLSDETFKSLEEIGHALVQYIRNYRDKSGLLLATEFINLPDRKLFPQYYEILKQPIAICMIEKNIRAGKYASLEEILEDFMLLVRNAKTFNDRQSLIYYHADLIGKLAVAFAVSDKAEYQIIVLDSDLLTTGQNKNADKLQIPNKAQMTKGITTKQKGGNMGLNGPAVNIEKLDARTGNINKLLAEDETGDNDVVGYLPDFKGKTFQQAQELIISWLIKYKDANSGYEMYGPFINLPPKQLQDYYQIIKHPTSLRSVQKKVRGIQGRNAASGVTLFSTWEAFEEEMSLIWKNSREYNEDGSEIVKLAGTLEGHFNDLVAAAKGGEEDVRGIQKLKLRVGPQPSIKLRLAIGRNNGTQGYQNSATERGKGSDKGKKGTKLSTDGKVDKLPDKKASGNDMKDERGGMKNSSLQTRSQAKGNTNATNGMLGAGGKLGRNDGVTKDNELGTCETRTKEKENGKEDINEANETRSTVDDRHKVDQVDGTTTADIVARATTGPTSQTMMENDGHGENEVGLRKWGAPLTEALLAGISLFTHPQLRLSKLYTTSIAASTTHTSFSSTLVLPATHYYLQIMPHIPIARMGRTCRVFVTLNGMPVTESLVMAAGAPTGVAEPARPETGDPSRPIYEVRCESGTVNRVDVEVFAHDNPGDSELANPLPLSHDPTELSATEGLTREKGTLFVYLY